MNLQLFQLFEVAILRVLDQKGPLLGLLLNSMNQLLDW